MNWFKKIVQLVIDYIKWCVHIMTKRTCPFCGSEDVYNSDNGSFDDHMRSETQTNSGVFMNITKICWRCNACHKTFVSIQ